MIYPKIRKTIPPFLIAVGLLSARETLAHTAQEVLVVYNAESPTSTAIAKDYAARRGVTQMLAVHCADAAVSAVNETIDIKAYTGRIAMPVGSYLAENPQINFIVLTKGVPLRVRGAATGSHDENLPTSAPLNASVDSYLAAIDYVAIRDAKKIAIHGSGARGFGWLNRYWQANEPFSHAKFGGYLVTRLDGYTQADAESLASRAIAGEKAGAAAGPILLDLQPIFQFKLEDVPLQPLRVTQDIADESDYGSWNADMVKASAGLKQHGIPVLLDQNEAFVGDKKDLLGYFSWGSNDPKYTPEAYHSLGFAPAAICDTAVSTSARTFLPATGGQSLIADLIAQGVTGVKGYTDEPLLQAIASPSVTLDRYFSGFTLAESFYAASRFVGWTDVVIGDPLALAPQKLRK